MTQLLNDSEQVDVLIVGGGPSGLSAALSLHHFTHQAPSHSTTATNGDSTPSRKPRILLVDALAHGQNESRALVIHARTLEALESIKCASPLLSFGIQSKGGAFIAAPSGQSPGHKLMSLDFALLNGLTKFPCGLLIPQHITEQALIDLLEERGQFDSSKQKDLQFIRGMRMTGMIEEERTIDGSARKGFLVTFEGGQKVWTQYLVGADGSKSAVRTLSQIPFSDPTPSNPGLLSRFFSNFFSGPKPGDHICLADVIFTEELAKKHKGLHGGMTVTFGTEGFALFVPIKLVGADRTRYFREMGGSEQDDHGEKYWYRFAFRVPDKELGPANEILECSKTQAQNGSAASSAPGHRDAYTSTSEAIEYLSRKLSLGVRYIPTAASPSEAPSGELDLPIDPSSPTGRLPPVKKVVWASIFRVRFAIADTFHKSFSPQDGSKTDTKPGHVLLIGDAGHIHSPAGGQGMNLGIRDGIDCGKAIAEHILSSSSPTTATTTTSDSVNSDPLEKFASSRRAAALETIKLTKTLDWLGSMPGNSFPARMRNALMWFLGMNEFGRKKFIVNVSGLRRD